jgi:Dolichyl-phosphate-mannose-protein mannosyltransferase
MNLTSATKLRNARRAVAIQVLFGGVIVAALSTCILSWLSIRQYVGFDSFWHVFIARQESWPAFFREIRENAHPPLFYLLLRGVIDVFGPSVFVYRLISIAGIALATVFLSLALALVTKNAPLAIVAAAAFAFSANAVEIGIEIRSYSVFLASIAAATVAWLDWLDTMPRATRASARILFAAASSTAILSHYSGFFVLGAMLTTPAVLYASHRRWRVKFLRETSRNSVALALMFGVPLLVAFLVYWFLIYRYQNGLNHVADFIFVPGIESRWTFFLHNSRNLLQLFVPDFGLPARLAIGAWCILFFLIFIATVRRFREGRLEAVPLVTLLLLLLLNVAAALAGKYPFGGNSRHELFVFLFAILALFAGIDAVRRCLSAPWSSERWWTAIAATPVAATLWITVSTFPLMAVQPLWHAQIERFRADFGTPSAVLVDEFNLVMFFGHYHDWRWHLRWQALHEPMCQVWEVSRGDRSFSVCRTREWLLNFSQPAAYAEISECIARSGSATVAVFRSQVEQFDTSLDATRVLNFAQEFAPKYGLSIQRIDVSAGDIYASFQASGDSEHPAAPLGPDGPAQ